MDTTIAKHLTRNETRARLIRAVESITAEMQGAIQMSNVRGMPTGVAMLMAVMRFDLATIEEAEGVGTIVVGGGGVDGVGATVEQMTGIPVADMPVMVAIAAPMGDSMTIMTTNMNIVLRDESTGR